MNSQLNVLFVTADQFRGDCLSAAGHPVVRTPNLDRLAASGVSFRRHFANAAPCGPSRAGALHRHVPVQPPGRDQRLAPRRPLHERRPRGPGARLRTGAVRLHRHRRRPPHGARRRSAPLQLRRRAPRPRPGLPPPRGRSAASGWSGWPRRATRFPTDWREFVDRPAPGTQWQTQYRAEHSPDRVPHRTPPRLRRRQGRHAVVRAPLLSASAPAVPRARAVRHDVRPGGGARPRARAVARGGSRAASAARRDDRPPVDPLPRRSAASSASSRRPTTA